MAAPPQHDYVVVGAGAAGCVVAAELARGGCTVCVLEAGQPAELFRDVTADVNDVLLASMDRRLKWAFHTDPEPALGGRRVPVNAARVVGGSGAHNLAVYARGSRHDFDEWERMGCRGWGYADVLPLYRKLEAYAEPGADAAFRGRGGAMPVVRGPATAFTAACLSAGAAAGLGAVDDYNAAEQVGVSRTQYSAHGGGGRCTSYDAWLRAALSSGRVTLCTNAKVRRVLLRGGGGGAAPRAVGVEYVASGGGGPVRVTARREVVVCCGAVGTPHLLQLSGVGPAAALRAAGVDPVVDAAGVGRNLQDHPFVHLFVAARRPLPRAPFVNQVIGFGRADGARSGRPDYQLGFFGREGFFKRGLPPRLQRMGVDPSRVVNIQLTCLHPRSRGDVTLRSADPDELPRIRMNYLRDPADVAVLQHGVGVMRAVARAPPLREWLRCDAAADEHWASPDGVADTPPPPAGPADAFLRETARGQYHPVGTCRMGAGADPGAVLDPELRVRGVAGLRVADASVLPTLPSGNTQAPVFLVALKCARMMLGPPRAAL